jgi:hypothetical protein
MAFILACSVTLKRVARLSVSSPFVEYSDFSNMWIHMECSELENLLRVECLMQRDRSISRLVHCLSVSLLWTLEVISLVIYYSHSEAPNLINFFFFFFASAIVQWMPYNVPSSSVGPLFFWFSPLCRATLWSTSLQFCPSVLILFARSSPSVTL